MATLVSDIIRDAFRESNLIAIGTEPNGNQQEEALRLLNRLVSSVYGSEEGEELQPIIIGRNNIQRPSGYPWYENVPDQTDWFVPSNSRLVLNITSPQTVYLSPTPMDGQRFAFIDKSDNLATHNFIVEGNGFTIEGEDSITFNTNGDVKEYMFRADIGDWVKVDPLESTDIWPFPREFDDMFVISLAVRINPRHDVALSPESLMMLNRSRGQFKARYRQSSQYGSELALVFTPGSSRDRGWYWSTPNSLFNSGVPFPFGMNRGNFRW